jgi:hypothetical protein
MKTPILILILLALSEATALSNEVKDRAQNIHLTNLKSNINLNWRKSTKQEATSLPSDDNDLSAEEWKRRAEDWERMYRELEVKYVDLQRQLAALTNTKLDQSTDNVAVEGFNSEEEYNDVEIPVEEVKISYP